MSLTILNKHGYPQILIALSLIGQLSVLNAEDAEHIYQYENSEGVTEFTDSVKEDEVPVNQIKIQKMTEQEKIQATEKLKQVEQENKELNQRLEAQKEQDLQNQKDRAQQKKEQQQSDEPQEIEFYNNGNAWDNRQPPLRPRPPVNRPIQPRPVQLPARGK
jgi:TolA-binding protein